MNILEIIKCIDQIISNLYKNERESYNLISAIIPDIRRYLGDFIEIIPQLNEIGMNIDMNMLVMQLQHLSDAIEKQNKVQLYDALNFEIKDTLLYYSEILTEINKE